ncbi:mesothelin-like, partial [Leptodactylus fuscus]
MENIKVFVTALTSATERVKLSQEQVDTVKETLLTVKLQQLQSRFATYTTEDWKGLFETDLTVLIQYFNPTLLQLLPINISCESYQAIPLCETPQTVVPKTAKWVTFTLHNLDHNMNSVPKCYKVGNYTWIVDNLQVYLTFCSANDLRSFSSNEVLLQQFSVDSKTLALVKSLNLTEDLLLYYAQLLTTQNPNFPIVSVPPNILCFAIANLNIGGINGSEAMATLNFLKTCNYSSKYTVNQVALSSLLSSVPNVTSEFLTSLGSLAVGLSTSTILQIKDISVLLSSMSTLSNISGWSITQASAIVTKLLKVDYPITASNLENLGNLITGLPSSKIDSLNSSDILHLASSSKFSTCMEQSSVALQQRFVLKVIQASSTTTILQSVPANLAGNIPVSNLITPTLNISAINQMKWKTSQAQVLFQVVLIQNVNYSILSSNILQGFTCGAANSLNDAQFVNLVKSMTGKSVNLGSSQLNCLTRRLIKNGAPADFTSYSSDVLLYLGPYTAPSQCKDYFTRVGKANINLLAQGSEKRVTLLSSARSCLGISSANNITKDTLQILGSLVCDLTPEEIANSDPYIVQALQSCSSFTGSQKSAILLKLKAIYGGPTTWSVSTLKEIRNLFSIIDSNTLRFIDTAVKRQFFPGFLTVIKVQYKTVFTSVMTQLKVPARLITRAAFDCDELTTDMIAKQQDYIVATYTATQLDECLSNTTLIANLEILGSLAFDNDQLQVLKNKLDTIFPTGVPEEYLLQIGNIAMMYTTEEISQWNITSVDTLEALLEGASWQTNDSKINALVTQYLSSTNATLDGTALTVLAPYICGLNETLIQSITDNEFKYSSNPLDTSTCTQGQKDILYGMMKTTYSSFNTSSNAYFQIMSPVIGGSNFEDLLLFSKTFPEMDLNTFIKLNPDVVKKLEVQIIMALLGNNIFDINTIFNSTVLQAWLSAHTQTEINQLGLNITGGMNETISKQNYTLSDVV